MNQDAIFRMERLLKLVNERAKEKIVTEGVDREVQALLLMKELIKEQIPNENTNTTAG